MLKLATPFRFAGAVLAATLALQAAPRARAQASALPSASAPQATGDDHGRKLLDLMVQALGGDNWLHVRDWDIQGRSASFYKGKPNEGVTSFEEFHRADPFGTRIEIISKLGVIFSTEHRDIVQVYTPTSGYEVTFKGKRELPADILADSKRRREHSIDNVIKVWLNEPGVAVVYEGTSLVERHSADKVTVLSAKNDAVTLELDQTTHLPLRRTFEFRNETYKDHDVDVEEYDDYHAVQGLPTALTITRSRNGDMVSQRFYTKVTYNLNLPPTLFGADLVLKKKK